MRQDAPRTYQITVEGELDPQWSDWLGGFVTSKSAAPDGVSSTTLTGMVSDQAALRGILNRLWDLNLTLVSVTLVDHP